MIQMVFDVKMKYFNRKPRLISKPHKTEPLPTINYHSVLKSETISIEHTLVTLNDLGVKACDIMNYYITLPVT